MNSEFNKDSQVLTEAEKEIQALVESGTDRIRGIVLHHKKTLSELKQQHKFVLMQKFKELRRRGAELRKDHEEEIEQIKMDQATIMAELMDTHLQSEETRADTAISQNLLGMMLPAHIMEKIELGIVPEPEQFACVTIFFTDFKKLVATIDPVNILHLLNALYTKFDAVIAKYPRLYKVESVSDTYMVAAGINTNSEKSKEEVAACAHQALDCTIELQALVNSMALELRSLVGDQPVKLRIGVHSGSINAGLIGTKMSRYCLFGDTVNTASRMCTTGLASKIQVSAQTIQILGDDETFEFEVRGDIEVK
ncbi:Retinal guanylyl cyclase 2, partial [Rhizoclosmatium hyalinum]